MHDEYKKPDLSDICQIEHDLIAALKTAVSHGVFSKEVDGKELGELVDMVKDMAETKRNCWEACYYESVTKAMEEYDEDPEYMMGYSRKGRNMNRYANGRYAPSGTGNQTYGYMPYPLRTPIMMRGDDVSDPDNYVYENFPMMGYSKSQRTEMGRGMYQNGNHQRNKYGSAYNEYKDAKRYYTETHSMDDKHHMDEKAMEHVNQSIMTLREIWKDADPEVKKGVSSSIASLASEFKSV